MATVYHTYRPCASEQLGNGLLGSCPFRYAMFCRPKHCMLSMENEQGSWSDNVPLLLRFRGCFSGVRIWDNNLSCLKTIRLATCRDMRYVTDDVEFLLLRNV